MNLVILLFIAAGLVFGALTFRHRHLFSEGASTPSATDGWGARLGWMTLSSLLWPLLAVSGVFGVSRARAKAAARR